MPLARLQFLGDISLDGLYCCPQNHQAFTDNCLVVREVLGACDHRIANWEAPIAGNGECNTEKKIRLATTWEAAESILPLGITVATLANNHAFDCGTSGFLRTCEFFRKHGIMHVGAGMTAEAASKPLLFEVHGISFALFNYCGEETRPSLPATCPVHFNLVKTKGGVVSKVSDWKGKVDHVLVGLHWGHRDNLECPPPSMRRFARSIIDAGASLVYGGQFHIMQGYETWESGCILYALGNYCFSPVGMSCGDTSWTGHPLSRKVGVACLDFHKTGPAGIAWRYFQQPEGSLLLFEDPSLGRRRSHLSRAAQLKRTEVAYRAIHRMNVVKWDVIDYIHMYGGVWRAVKRLRLRHVRRFLAWVGGRSLRS